MQFVRSLSLVALTACILASCTKETSYEPDLPVAPGTGGGGNNNTDIEGVYDFVGMTAHTEVNNIIVADGETIRSSTITDYYSVTQSGVAEFKNGKFTSTNFEYTVEGTMKGNTDGQIVELPFNFTAPTASASGNYRKVGNDSLHCPGIVDMPAPGGGTTPTPSVTDGYRYSWSGDTLLLRAVARMTDRQSMSGMVVNSHIYANVVTKLKKRK